MTPTELSRWMPFSNPHLSVPAHVTKLFGSTREQQVKAMHQMSMLIGSDVQAWERLVERWAADPLNAKKDGVPAVMAFWQDILQPRQEWMQTAKQDWLIACQAAQRTMLDFWRTPLTMASVRPPLPETHESAASTPTAKKVATSAKKSAPRKTSSK